MLLVCCVDDKKLQLEPALPHFKIIIGPESWALLSDDKINKYAAMKQW